MSGTIVQAGNLNTVSLTVPGLTVQLQQPSPQVAGAPTNVMGAVGTAIWGPVDQASICSGQSDYTSQFGPLQDRKYDLGTVVAAAQVIGGCSNFRVVRRTDGTDIEASYQIPAAALAASPGFFAALGAAINQGTGTLRAASALVVFSSAVGLFVARYSGSLGNSLSVGIGAGSKAGTFRAIVGLVAPGMPQQTEVFDNIVSGVGDAVALTNAAPYVLSGGTDGTDTITAQVLIGQDVAPRTGMYALRQQGCAQVVVADSDDASTWTTQAAFVLSEAAGGVVAGPSGDSIANAVATKAQFGVDTTGLKVMFGDWCYFNDGRNPLRAISPAAIVAGRRVALAPNQSTLNKKLLGIVGTQKQGQPGTRQATSYSSAELQELFQNGIDVIGNPSPGGRYFSVLRGCNASSSAQVNGENYTSMTNFLVSSLAGAGGMGQFIGEPIYGTGYFREVRSALQAFLYSVYQQGYLPTYGSALPFSVQCDDPTVDGTNNPEARVAQGYVQADIQVQLQAITLFLIANLVAGQTVTVSATASAS